MKKSRTEILSLDSLKIGYTSGKKKKLLLPPLSASACEGEMIAVIGRNGIGKSTLLRTIMGLIPSLGGQISIFDKYITEYSRLQLAQKAGYISTEIVKVSNMKVYDLVALGRFPHTNWIGKIDAQNHQIIMESIDMAGMSEFQNRFVSELSDGERQKAMIARVLAQDTDIMIMDEPTAFLDITSKYEIAHLLHKLTKKRGKTVIFSTHDLHLAISQADKIWLLLNNDLKEGAPEDLMLEGDFDKLFNTSQVIFNSGDGSITFKSEVRGEIFIEGEGLTKYWTEKAITRAGFSVSETKTCTLIKVPSESKNKWLLQSENSYIEFTTIYDLINWLSQENKLVT